ncbi:hypothetical protein CASFOL_017665 [Castilleja foliolosa]|uniref:Xyloglucan endotransglucosylase/hydrolase n=1 Tax=Castilleja foliolosa TaxID=1961234 RepID=A0ABD3D8W3_9LAMI
MESFVLKVSIVMALASSSAGNFNQDVHITWGGPQRAWIDNGGQVLHLSLDKQSGSGFASNKMYLYSRFDMQLKLIPGNSAGTVTSFYLSSSTGSSDSSHDEIDFEFLGNSSEQPYTLSTNIFINGEGNREQQFHLWFDPTKDYHTYTILWNSTRIIQMVDKIPIRVFNNYVAYKVPFPTSRRMSMIGSLWNADWATQGGKVKIDWRKAPFKATYQNLNIVDCVVKSTSNSCKGEMNGYDRRLLRWVQEYHRTYNYCDDKKRYPKGLPKECAYQK